MENDEVELEDLENVTENKHYYFEYLFKNNSTLSNNDAIQLFNRKFPTISCLTGRDLSLIRQNVKN